MVIIAIDLDETLLKTDKTISKYSKEILSKCKKAGHIIAVNSARSLVRTQSMAKEIGADYINCFHGNLLADKDGNVLFSRALKCDKLAELISDFKGVYNGWCGIEALDNGYGTDKNVCKVFGATYALEGELVEHEPLKLCFEFENGNRDSAIAVATKYDLDICFNREGTFVTMLPKNTDKWFGLERLLQISGKTKKELIVFGDHTTDLLSMQNAGIAVAMSNSVPEVLKEIKIHTLSNDEDGVAKYLEKELFTQKIRSI